MIQIPLDELYFKYIQRTVSQVQLQWGNGDMLAASIVTLASHWH